MTYASSPRVESIPAAPVAIPRVDTSHFVLVKFASAHVPPSGHISEPAAHAAARALHALSTPPAGSIASLINATNVTPGPVAPPPQPGPPAGEPALIAQPPQQKAFACHWEGCTRSFDRRYNLKVHFRRHTNETPYPCKAAGCEERFKWRSSLAHHMRTRHPEEVAAGAGVEAGRRGNGKRKREEAVPAADSPLTEENAEAGGGASAATE